MKVLHWQIVPGEFLMKNGETLKQGLEHPHHTLMMKKRSLNNNWNYSPGVCNRTKRQPMRKVCVIPWGLPRGMSLANSHVML